MRSKLADVTAERQYLLAVIAQPDHVERYPLAPQDFSDGECAAIMRLVLAMRERGEPIGIGEVIREATRANIRLDEYALLWDVQDTLALPTQRRLLELATARRLRAAFATCVAECEALRVESAEQIAIEVLDGLKRREETNVESSATTVERIAQNLVDGKKNTLIPTGITKIDLVTGGIEPGTLTFVGGDTGVGKSSLMLYMADRMMRCKRRPGFISCEDSREVLGTRILSSFSGVSGLKIRRGDLTKDMLESVSEAIFNVGRRSMPIAYETGSTDAQVAQAMTSLVRDHGCDTIFVDYIQTINCSEGGENRREDVRRIASRLKGTAARLGVPVIVGSQISVGDIHAEFKEPGKHALKESRDLTNMAEWVILIWKRNNEDAFAPVEGKLAKSKCGGDGTRFSFQRNEAGVLVECDERMENAYD